MSNAEVNEVKAQVNEEALHLKAENQKLARALWRAAGYISATKGWTDKHPQDAYDWLLAQSEDMTQQQGERNE